jgi:hypothetical protein
MASHLWDNIRAAVDKKLEKRKKEQEEKPN